MSVATENFASLRYMNVESLVRWGQVVLVALDPASAQTPPLFELDHVQDKLGWVERFRSPLAEWGSSSRSPAARKVL